MIERISRGNTLQSAGAATWNDLSPKVTLLLEAGVGSNKPSEHLLIDTSSLEYIGANPWMALKTNSRILKLMVA